MATNWGSIASQLASMGLTNLARGAISNGAEAGERQRHELHRRTEAEPRERCSQEAPKRESPTAAMVAIDMQLRSLSSQQLESSLTELVAYLRAGASGQVSSWQALARALRRPCRAVAGCAADVCRG